jgi:transposase
MIGERTTQDPLFIPGSLRDLIPDDYILKQVDAILDLRWVREEVAELYDLTTGRPSIPPECAVRLMLAGFFLGIVHDRKLLREAQVHLGIRWFAGYALDEALPEHSSLTRIRQRWGAERFKAIFRRTVRACIDAGLVSGETVHIDATLIRADVSWESVAADYAARTLAENTAPEETPARARRAKIKKRSATDPEATLATSSKDYHLEPSYKQHTAVDDQSGVIVDVEVTTGETSEGTQLPDQLERVADVLGHNPTTVTADTAYAHGANYAACEARGIDAVIPPRREARRREQRLPARRFRYDPRRDCLTCPAGHLLCYASTTERGGRVYRAPAAACRGCPLRARCLPPSAHTRQITLFPGTEALLRARRRHERGWDDDARTAYRRHRWRAEGVHGEGKTRHGLRRAARRGLDNVAIQAYLTAAVINLKRLARQWAAILLQTMSHWAPHRPLARLMGLLRHQKAPDGGAATIALARAA